jgi:hypothetical protein
MSILASVRTKYIPIAPSTALCFSLIGLGLIMQIVRPSLRWKACLLSLTVLAIGQVGPAMRILPSASYRTATRSMSKGDLIMLFTDGLFEVEDRDGNVFSQQELFATVNRHAGLPPEEFFSRAAHELGIDAVKIPNWANGIVSRWILPG